MVYDESCSSPSSSSSAPRESKVRLPGGFHFRPEDGELIEHYLLRRCLGCPLPVDIIPDIQDPYQHPSILNRPLEYAGENKSYFFTKLKQKRGSDRRKKRSIKGGFWKTTGELTLVRHEKKKVGHKKRFTFYEVDEDKRNKKTDWIMYEYTVDESTFVGDGERMEYVLWILYNNRKSSNDSPNARSDPPCPSSPDIASSRVQSQDVYYSDNGISFVSQSSNVDTPKVSREAVTSPDILMINKDNQVQHSAQLYGANLSSAPYSSTQDISSLGILQKELARCNGAAYSVLPQFSHGMPSPSTSQVIEVYNQALMDVDPLVQNLFQLYDAELSSATNSSQNMASLEIHPATPNCNQAIPSTTQWGNGMLVDSLEMMEVDRRVLSEEGQLVQFSLMQLENMPQDNIPSNTFTRREELDLWDPKIPYCNQAIPSTTQLGNGMLATGSEMMEVDGRVLSNGGQPVQFPLLQLENMPQGNIPLNSFTWQEKLGGWQSSMNEVHPQQHAPQHQKDISLADMLYSNDYPQQLGDPYEAYTHQGALQTLQVQPYALWHDEGVAQADMSFNSIMQPEHHLMNNSQQQHARQHDEDDERPAYLLEGFKPEEELQSMQQLMNDSANC